MNEPNSARVQHTLYFSHRGEIVFTVLHNAETDDKINATIPEREDLQVGLDLIR